MSNGIATYSNYNLERGEYLSLSYQGNLKNTKKYMPKIFEFAKNNGITIKGDPIE